MACSSCGDSGCGGCGGITIPKGDSGNSTITRIAYANDASGSGFSLTNGSLDFIAFAAFDPSYTPVAADFAGLWYDRSVTNGTNGTTLLYSNVNTLTCASNSSDETLDTYVLPANTLSVNGNMIELEGIIKGATSFIANPVDIALSFAGNILTLSGGTLTFQQIPPRVGLFMHFSAKIVRVSSTSFKFHVVSVSNGGLTPSIVWSSTSAISAGVNFAANTNILFNVLKNGLTQVAGDFNLVNYNIKQYIQ